MEGGITVINIVLVFTVGGWIFNGDVDNIIRESIIIRETAKKSLNNKS